MICLVKGFSLFLLILFLSSSFLNAQTIICAKCNKPVVNETYVTVDGKNYHSEHFMCDNCGKPIGSGSYFKQDGKYYDEECYISVILEKCAYCGEPLRDEYLIHEGKKYHKHCYLENIALRCDLCGEPITGEYIVSHWGEKYHKEHEGTLPKCDYCGRLISDALTGGGFEYVDGRKICGICIKSAVSEMDEARRLFREVKSRLDSQGIVISKEDIGLKLVDRWRIAELSNEGRINTKQTGFTHFRETTRGERTVKQEFTVYILHGMPEIDYISTVAHELMHVWQYLNAVREITKTFSEGSCNYAALLVLNTYRDDRVGYILESMEEDSDPYYGGGYRSVKRFVKRNGKSAWLSRLKSYRSLPREY